MKTLYTVLIIFLSISLIELAPLEVKAQTNIIYIKEDGTVEGTDKIHRDGSMYSFVDNLSHGIVVERGNIVIDGAGYTLQGDNTEFGIRLESNRVSIKNMQISGFDYGIYVYLSSNNNFIVNNRISGTSRAIYVRGTDNNKITGNKLTNNGEGIYLSGTNNVLRDNELENNSYNFGVIPHLKYNDIDTSNIVNGKPIYYWFNQHDKTVPLDAGCVILINCTNIKVQNLSLTNNKEGIAAINTKNSEIKNCILSNHKSGIRTSVCSNVRITQNVFKRNGEGLAIWGSTGMLVNGNIIANNTRRGIEFFKSKEKNFISDNTIYNSSVGVELSASSNYNTLAGNTITNCEQAILFTVSTYNVLRNNNMSNNEHSFHIVHYDYSDASKEISYFISDIDSSNTIDGNPMYCWVNQNDKVIPYDAGCIILVNCTNITIQNLNLTDEQYILLAFTNNSSITNNTVTNSIGITLWESSNNIITENVIINSTPGLEVKGSQNSIYNNCIKNSTNGFTLQSSKNNSVFSNLITANNRGIYLSYSRNNNIFCNNITNNKYAIWLWDSNNNIFYQNNFINNTITAHDSFAANINPKLNHFSSNIWDYNNKGNHWDDYDGIDDNNDGIGDSAYAVEGEDIDNYPLMNPVEVHAIPEFPSWALLPLLLLATLACVFFKNCLVTKHAEAHAS